MSCTCLCEMCGILFRFFIYFEAIFNASFKNRCKGLSRSLYSHSCNVLHGLKKKNSAPLLNFHAAAPDVDKSRRARIARGENTSRSRDS